MKSELYKNQKKKEKKEVKDKLAKLEGNPPTQRQTLFSQLLQNIY